jgi:hypothetical protein
MRKELSFDRSINISFNRRFDRDSDNKTMSFASPRDQDLQLNDFNVYKNKYLDNSLNLCSTNPFSSKINLDKLSSSHTNEELSKKIAISILNSPHSYGSSSQ